jgi:hypothetical protein
VKGTAIESVIGDLKRLVEGGRISREQLELRLDAEDLELLEQKLLPSVWYPLGCYGRMTQLLLETEGRGRLEYLIERGRRAAERLRAAGLYAQLTAARERWGESLGSMMVTLGPALYRDTVSAYCRLDEGRRFESQMSVPATFPDVCRHTTQGVIEHAASHAAGQPVRVTSERVSETRIVFRGTTL